METGLDGQVALVVGAGSGIGQATATQFSHEGATVVVAGRRLAPLEQVVRDIEDLGGTAMAYRTDVSVPDDVDRLVGATVDRFGTVHAVANCAAVVDRVENMLTGGVDDFDQVINVNLRGAWLLIRAAGKAMIAAGNAGRLGYRLVDQRPPTGDGRLLDIKGWRRRTTRAAANVLGQYGIRVNAVRSGFIDTAMLRYAWDVPPDVPFPIGPGHQSNVPLGRVGQPAESAAAIVWLCSQAASYVTGTCLDVDGGALAD